MPVLSAYRVTRLRVRVSLLFLYALLRRRLPQLIGKLILTPAIADFMLLQLPACTF